MHTTTSTATTRHSVAHFASRACAIALLAAGLTFASSSGSQAVFNAVQAQHFVDCAGWLLSDPQMHAANCLPSRVVLPLGSISSPGSAYTPATQPPPTDSPNDNGDHCKKKHGCGHDYGNHMPGKHHGKHHGKKGGYGGMIQ